MYCAMYIYFPMYILWRIDCVNLWRKKNPTNPFGSGFWTQTAAEAKQLCRSGQQATALYVFYLQWNLYGPDVTGTWMGPSVFILFWRHFIIAGGTSISEKNCARRFRRRKQCWSEAMLLSPGCATGLCCNTKSESLIYRSLHVKASVLLSTGINRCKRLKIL